MSQLRGLGSPSQPRFLRVGVKSKGCSGNSYRLEFTEKKDRFDEIVEQDGNKDIQLRDKDRRLKLQTHRCHCAGGCKGIADCAWL